MRLRCLIAAVWETATMPIFWTSLVHPPLVVMSGHIWSDPEWSAPRPSAYPEQWAGLVEVDLSHCVRCGYQPEAEWRRVWLST